MIREKEHKDENRREHERRDENTERRRDQDDNGDVKSNVPTHSGGPRHPRDNNS